MKNMCRWSARSDELSLSALTHCSRGEGNSGDRLESQKRHLERVSEDGSADMPGTFQPFDIDEYPLVAEGTVQLPTRQNSVHSF